MLPSKATPSFPIPSSFNCANRARAIPNRAGAIPFRTGADRGVEPLQVGMDHGARRALVPIENKRNFLEVSGDIVERVDPVFFSDPMTAAMKSLGMT